MRKVNEVEVVEWKEWQISLRGLRLGPCLALRLRLRFEAGSNSLPPRVARGHRGWAGSGCDYGARPGFAFRLTRATEVGLAGP